jgi:hypothetical protein
VVVSIASVIDSSFERAMLRRRTDLRPDPIRASDMAARGRRRESGNATAV